MPLLTIWSPKGGSGTSVFATACAAVLATHSERVRLVDLGGDLPAILGLGTEPERGVVDWLAAGASAPPDALERLATDASAGISLLARGGRRAPVLAPAALAERGAALAAALRDHAAMSILDAGVPSTPAARAVVEVSAVAVVVVRPCYLTLRRAVEMPCTARAAGIVVIDEPNRSLGESDVEGVLGRPVIARVPVRAEIARAVDAGMLAARPPGGLRRACVDALRAVGALGRSRDAA